jgi:hypothetical protein
VAATAAMALTTTTSVATPTTGSALGGDAIGTAKFEEQSATGVISPDANTIPSWTSSYTDPSNGASYHYTMVGTDPAKGDRTTTVPVVIIPMNFNFDASADSTHALNGSDVVSKTVASPVFARTADIGASANKTASAPPQPPDAPAGVAPTDARPLHEPSDTTQVGDAIYRAQFDKTGSGYHVLLGNPSVQAPATIEVPKNQGEIVVGSASHSHIGLMSYSWFSAQLKNLLVQRKIDPTVLPLFLVNNTFLYEGTEDNCCVLGYHGATSSTNSNGKAQVNTYMFASYSAQGVFSPNAGDSESYIADIHGLSHEVQEWYDDPFVNNVVNPWLTPTAPQYGCTGVLETGDPVVGYGFKVKVNGTTYHPEDEVHASWFERQSPSRAAQGYYTYLNNFAGPAKGC